MPSMSILLHELFKLFYHAGAKNVIYIRIGTRFGEGGERGVKKREERRRKKGRKRKRNRKRKRKKKKVKEKKKKILTD